MAPPLIDTFIVPEVPAVLYALFDYGLTKLMKELPNLPFQQQFYITTCFGQKISYICKMANYLKKI